MRRFLLFAAVIVICISSFFFYQYHVQQKAVNTEQMFEVVNYKLMSEFLLNYWMQNVEARNHYLRQLKAANWDTFLDVERLDQDRQQAYKDTEQMLREVRKISTEYERKRQQIQTDSLEQAKSLAIHNEMRKSLQVKLEHNLKVDKAHDIFPIEQQIIEKAQAMFDMLKTYPWQKQDKMILFQETIQVKKFNSLYQDVLRLNAKMEKIKKSNVEVLDEEL